MAREFDLLGDPIPENHGKPGANGHTPTAETLRKVRVLLVSGMPKKRIAEELGISMPTLTKHYFHSGKVKVKLAHEFALAEQRAKVLLQLDEAASGGNVSAMKAMKKILDEEDMKLLAAQAAGDTGEPAKTRPMPKGKKEQLTAGAAAAIESDPLLDPERMH